MNLAEHIVSLERSALDRWIRADPDGYLGLYAKMRRTSTRLVRNESMGWMNSMRGWRRCEASRCRSPTHATT
jgi:hypothetical protein